MMTFRLVFFWLFISCTLQAQIQEGIVYSENEIAIQDKFVEAKKYTLIGRFEKAEEILKSLYNNDRTNAAIAMELSKVYGYLEDPYNEFTFAKRAFENEPEREYVVINYANVCMDQEKYNEAIPVLKTLVESNKASEAFSDQLATAYLQTNDAESALATYNALENEVGVSENISRRKYEIYEILGKEGEALKELEQLSAAFPNEIRFLHNLASYYSKLGKDEKALEVYERILELDVNDTAANLALASSATGDGDENNYLRALKPIVENPSIPIDRKVLELIPYVNELSETYDQQLSDALIMLAERIAVIHPGDAKTHALYGDILLASKRDKDAAKAYEKTIQIDDKNYLVWEGLMEAYSNLNDTVRLLKTATDALDFYPNKASAYMFYGRAHSWGGDFKEAIDVLSEGMWVAGKDIYYKSNLSAELARAYLGNNDLNEAMASITSALKMSNDQNGLALEIYGDILFKQGEVQKALQQWNKAQKAGVNTKSLQEKIELQKL